MRIIGLARIVAATGGVFIATVASTGTAHADTLVRIHADPSASKNIAVHIRVDGAGQCGMRAHDGQVLGGMLMGDNFWAFDPHAGPSASNCYLLKASVPEVKSWPRGSYTVYAL